MIAGTLLALKYIFVYLKVLKDFQFFFQLENISLVFVIAMIGEYLNMQFQNV